MMSSSSSDNESDEINENSLVSILKDNFSKEENSIVKELKVHLKLNGLSKEYQKEIFAKFTKNANIIFDMKKDEKTFFNFVTKVYGKSNIASFLIIELKNDEVEEEVEEYLTIRQLIFLSGSMKLEEGIFNFQKSDLFTYGNFTSVEEQDYKFTLFKSQNSYCYVKVEENAAYGIFNAHNNYRMVFKFQKDFFANPVIEVIGEKYSEDMENYFEKNGHEKVAGLFAALKTSKAYVKELIIYEIE